MPLEGWAYKGFNSMIVRLKATTDKATMVVLIGFNSMIVRLKASIGMIQQREMILFQFYDSPIKSYATR